MKRISGYISEDLHGKIDEIAERDNRSFNQTLSILLDQAVKERERNRLKNAKRKNLPAGDNSANSR